MVLFAKFRRLIRVLKKYTLKFIFRPWKGAGAGFGCPILFGFAAFQDKFHGALLAGRLLMVFSPPKNPSVFLRRCPRDGKAGAEEGYGVILWGFQEILWDFNVL